MYLKPLNNFNMQTFYHLIKNARLFLLIKTVIITLFLMSSCDSDDDTKEEPFPVFGTCKAVNPVGNLTSIDLSKGTFTYETNGGGKIVFKPTTIDAGSIIISHEDYPDFKLEFWGTANVNSESKIAGHHESLNGKHIKDRTFRIRTMIFPDDAKITMVSSLETGTLTSITIYEGYEIHHLNMVCNILEYSSVHSKYTKQIDDVEADGETGTFELTDTGLLFLNIYTEKVLGQKVDKRVILGELHKDEPFKISDHYNDPRFGHT